MRVAIATTTIFPLDFLPAYVENLLRFGHASDVTIYIAGDRKSPASSADAAAAARTRGVDARYLSLDAQNDYLRKFPDLAALIPENSDNRRNVAFLMALDDGADVVISIDDDNYCLPDVDFVDQHLCVGTDVTLPSGTGRNGWYNPCSTLRCEPPVDRLYPRGFPYRARGEGTDAVGPAISGRVAVNAGLWLRDPDCDAIGRLQDRPSVARWEGPSVLLPRTTLTPVNTQNTALTRDAMSAYYYVRMGATLRGLVLDRFGDILSGYFVQVCAHAVGEHVRFGDPIVEHRRHQHDLLRDLYHELAGIMLLEDLSDLLATVSLPDTTYGDAYVALSHALESFADTQDGFVWTGETQAYLSEVARSMRVWTDVVASLG